MSTAIILAAGMGRRMQAMGWDRPKCLLPIAGKTLLEHTREALGQCGIDHDVLVAGYRRELIQQAVVNSATTIVLNGHYASTNTLHSLWLARSHFADLTVVVNGDLLFEPEILRSLLASKESAIAIAENPCGEEEVKVICNQDRVIQIGKKLPTHAARGESIGLVVLRAPATQALAEALERQDKKGGSQLYYETALDEILSNHFLRAVPIGTLRAIEIDTPQDYNAAVKLWSR